MKKLIVGICIVLAATGGCSLSAFMTANALKDGYCDLPASERDKAVELIRKVFPDWQPICEVLPDII